ASLSVTVDGMEVSDSNSPISDFFHNIVTGDLPEIVRVSTLAWTDASTLATVTTRYTLHRQWGLVIDRRFLWEVDVRYSNGYFAMYPFSNDLNVGSNIAGTTDDGLSNDTGAFVANAAGDTVYAWETPGTRAVGHFCVDVT